MARASLMKQMSFHDKYILERLNGDFRGINYTTRPQSLGGGAEKLFINKNELICVLDKYQSLKDAVGNI